VTVTVTWLPMPDVDVAAVAHEIGVPVLAWVQTGAATDIRPSLPCPWAFLSRSAAASMSALNVAGNGVSMACSEA
jgi:hypothetical protein